MIALLIAGGFSLVFTLLLTPLFGRLFKKLSMWHHLQAVVIRWLTGAESHKQPDYLESSAHYIPHRVLVGIN